jgi:hypothetical protein
VSHRHQYQIKKIILLWLMIYFAIVTMTGGTESVTGRTLD